MQVECINDDSQGWDGEPGDRVVFGHIYTLIGTYYSDFGTEMYLLNGMCRQDPLFGDGWAHKRFKPLDKPETIVKEKEVETV